VSQHIRTKRPNVLAAGSAHCLESLAAIRMREVEEVGVCRVRVCTQSQSPSVQFPGSLDVNPAISPADWRDRRMLDSRRMTSQDTGRAVDPNRPYAMAHPGGLVSTSLAGCPKRAGC